jgi:hypothetical protein
MLVNCTVSTRSKKDEGREGGRALEAGCDVRTRTLKYVTRGRLMADGPATSRL